MQTKMTGEAYRFEAACDLEVTVETAAAAACAIYGADARTAVAWCAINARSNGRAADYTFWVQVFREMPGDA